MNTWRCCMCNRKSLRWPTAQLTKLHCWSAQSLPSLCGTTTGTHKDMTDHSIHHTTALCLKHPTHLIPPSTLHTSHPYPDSPHTDMPSCISNARSMTLQNETPPTPTYAGLASVASQTPWEGKRDGPALSAHSLTQTEH